MLDMLSQILKQTGERVSNYLLTYLPGMIVGFLILLLAFAAAILARWILMRLFKGISFDRFLARSGIAALISPSGKLRGTALVAGAAYWIILATGTLTAVSALDHQMTSRLIEGVVLLAPKLLAAAAILLGGIWLGQYLGRSVLLWAFGEGMSGARHMAACVRAFMVFAASAAAADYLGFARSVFLAAFIIVTGGVALAAALAFGFGGPAAIRRFFAPERKEESEESRDEAWKHL